jgi:hypothetical protein
MASITKPSFIRVLALNQTQAQEAEADLMAVAQVLAGNKLFKRF